MSGKEGPKDGDGESLRDPLGHRAVRPFGKYFLVRKLAEGGMAEIFLAKQVGVEGFERNVVIKRMLQHLSSVPDFVAMFLDEARLAARLSHPNIVNIADLGHADGCYYICMEYLAGEDFSTLLRTSARRRDYVPLHISLRVLAEAARGLEFAHSFTDAQGKPVNIVHRDISPSNIFVTYTGQVKVLDFGIAKAESRVTQTTAGVVKGKYMYMAPEQARSGQVDRRADVFSLGVSLYEALTNVRPFARDNDLAILNAVLTCDYKPPRTVRPDLPAELEAVVQKAMSPKAENRHQTAAEFADDLERFLAASTSASGAMQLSTFMESFFGSVRVVQKTRIDSLGDLAAKGWDVPGYSNPDSPATDPGHGPPKFSPPTQSDERTKAIRSGVTKKRSNLVPLAVGALGTLLVGGGALVVNKLWFSQPPLLKEDAGEGVSTPDSGPVEPEVDAGILFDAGVTLPDIDAGTHPIQAQRCPPGLTATQLIMRAIKERYSDLAACFEDYKNDLPEAQGVLRISFEIDRQGRFAKALADNEELKGSQVSKCVEKRIRSMKVACYKGGDAKATLPLAWSVKK